MTSHPETMWGAISAITVAIIGVFAAWRTTGGGRQPGAASAPTSAATEQPTQPVEIPTGTGRTIEQHVPESLVPVVRTMASTMSAMQATIDGQQARLAEQARLIDTLQSEARTRDRADVERDEREQRLVAHLEVVHDWIDAGATPPPPARPSWLHP